MPTRRLRQHSTVLGGMIMGKEPMSVLLIFFNFSYGENVKLPGNLQDILAAKRKTL